MAEGALNALSLCSGIGGLDLGLERTGRIRVRGQVEIDPWCRAILAAHWPEVPRHDDIRTCARWWACEPRPRVGLVCGGFPCQPHSAAGRRRGTADPRWLWPGFAAVIEAVRPPLVLIENVPRLVRSGLADVLRDLAGLGFDAWWTSVPAAAFGAPHLRWRFFLIAAHPGRVALAREPWTGPPRRQRGYDGTSWLVADPLGAGPEDRRVGPGVDGAELPAAVRDGDRRQPGAREPGLDRGPDGPASWLDGTWERGIARVAPAGKRGRGAAERNARACAIGNAVVPAVAEYAGNVLLGCL